MRFCINIECYLMHPLFSTDKNKTFFISVSLNHSVLSLGVGLVMHADDPMTFPHFGNCPFLWT
jgi:hypothetical protein